MYFEYNIFLVLCKINYFFDIKAIDWLFPQEAITIVNCLHVGLISTGSMISFDLLSCLFYGKALHDVQLCAHFTDGQNHFIQ